MIWRKKIKNFNEKKLCSATKLEVDISKDVELYSIGLSTRSGETLILTSALCRESFLLASDDGVVYERDE